MPLSRRHFSTTSRNAEVVHASTTKRARDSEAQVVEVLATRLNLNGSLLATDVLTEPRVSCIQPYLLAAILEFVLALSRFKLLRV